MPTESDKFSHHEACPRCRSRDNLGVWKDTHKFCFGCSYYIPAKTTLESVESYITKKNKDTQDVTTAIVLPSDSIYHVPSEPRRWLNQYGITEKEIVDNKLMWSQSKEMLIFPYCGEQDKPAGKKQGQEMQLLFWQGRHFPRRIPKTITYGNPNRYLNLFNSGSSSFLDGVDGGFDRNRVAIVEDPVSAIKVARYTTSHCLFGSYLSLTQVQRLSRYFKKLYIWLDQDKTKEAMKFQQKYSMLFDEIIVVSTKDDPKMCSDEEIKRQLNAN